MIVISSVYCEAAKGKLAGEKESLQMAFEYV